MSLRSSSKLPTANRLFFINFERHPGPVNVTSYLQTANFADSRSNHPYHIRTVRRHRDFDASKLHWSVTVPTDVSRSAFIRNRVARRVREAFREELRKAGWDSDGRRIAPAAGGEAADRRPAPADVNLAGALKLGMVKDPFALTATNEEVKLNVAWAVRSLIALQKSEGSPFEKKGAAKNHNGKPKGKTNRSANAQGMKSQRAMSKD